MVTTSNPPLWAIRCTAPAALLSELIPRHISKLQEDGLLFSRMMIVTTQKSIWEKATRVIFACRLQPVKPRCLRWRGRGSRRCGHFKAAGQGGISHRPAHAPGDTAHPRIRD